MVILILNFGVINLLIKKKGGRPRIKVPVDEIVKLYDEGKSVRQLAEIYHVSKSTISNIVRNPQKYHIEEK